MDNLEPPADDPRATKKRAHLFGCRVGSNVKVLGLPAQQQVSNTTTDEAGAKTGVLETVQYLECCLADTGT